MKMLQDADIVYPKSWAPFGAMEKRTKLYGDNDHEGIKALEKVLLEENGKHKDWACTEEMMSLTKDGKALYLHCLPADITGVSCEERRSRRNSIRSLPRTSLQRSKLQTICYCSYDLLK